VIYSVDNCLKRILSSLRIVLNELMRKRAAVFEKMREFLTYLEKIKIRKASCAINDRPMGSLVDLVSLYMLVTLMRKNKVQEKFYKTPVFVDINLVDFLKLD